MSGPKVVRIVTVEEVRAICRRLMAQVEAGGAELRRLAGRLGAADSSLEASLATRSRQMQALFSENRWMELQKFAADTLTFYPEERIRLQAEATARAEAARSRRRRLADGARTIAEALIAAGEDVPGDVAQVIAGAANAPTTTLDDMERVLGAALSRVPARTENAASTKAAADLAGRLSFGESTSTLADWLSSHAVAPSSAERRLDRLVAELEVLDRVKAMHLAERIAGVSGEVSASRRTLLIDSLILETSTLVAEVKRRDAAFSALEEVLAVLETSGTEAAAALRDRIRAARGTASTAEAGALVATATSLLEEEQKAIAAAARRQAVLSALSTLGYEVRDTMETTWMRDGRVVLRKPGSPDYGVEVGTPPDASRFQVRLVGSDHPTAPRSARRDADQETIWCGEFDQLRERLALLGDELVVERALEPGAQAVRTVSLPSLNQVEDGGRAAKPQLRRLY